MKINAIAITVALCVLLILLTATSSVRAQNFVQYKVQVNSDGSAVWIITQATDLNETVESWQGFQQQVTSLVATARDQTKRDMSLDNNSLQMNTVWETQSQTTEYEFTWLNFSTIEGNRLTFGDVFQVNNFFNQLFGDGEIQVVYPVGYEPLSVSPPTNGGDSSPQTLDWLGTQFFVNGNPSVTLTETTSTSSSNSFGWQAYAQIAAGVVAVVVMFSVALLLVRRRKSTPSGSVAPDMHLAPVESEEEKILKVIRASGGSTHQSDITEKCGFSKAKTSQLLTALEKRGIVTRYKKGRDKIVNLAEPSKISTS